MPIPVQCPSCSATANAPNSYAGKVARCKKCSADIPIPQPAEANVAATESPEDFKNRILTVLGQEATATETKKPISRFRLEPSPFSLVVRVIGLLGCAYYAFAVSTVHGDVHNLGLLVNKVTGTLFFFALIVFASGPSVGRFTYK